MGKQNKVIQEKQSKGYDRFCYLCSNTGMVHRGYARQAVDFTIGYPTCLQRVPCPKCEDARKEQDVQLGAA